MKSDFEFTGIITSANLVEPEQKFWDNEPKFKLEVEPYNYGFLEEIETQAERYKETMLKPWRDERRRDYGIATEVRPDRITKGSCVLLETIRQPHLYDSVNAVSSDDELIGKFVKVKGHIQILEPDENAFLSFHIVDDAQRPSLIEFDEDELTGEFDEDF